MDPRPRVWPEKADRLTLSPKGVLACLGSQDDELGGLLPFLSKDEIWDKSKANSLAKAIVCIQAIWFCAQVIGRLAQGIPISLLELNTFAHALCALLIYILWWSKPLDIQEPSVIDVGRSDAARNVCVMGWSGLQGPVAHFRSVDLTGHGSWLGLLKRAWRAVGASRQGHISDSTLTCQVSNQPSTTKHRAHAVIAGLEKSLPLPQRPSEFRGLTLEQRNSCVWVSTFPPVFSVNGGERIPSTSVCVSNAWESIEVDEILMERLKVMEKLQTSSRWKAYEKALHPVLNINDKDHCMLKPRELNFTDSLMRHSFDDISPVSRNLVATFGIILSGFLYGGLHMTAWGSTTFHTPLEQTLWIISCCTVALGGLSTFLGIWVLDKVSNLHLAVYGVEVATILLWVSAPMGIVISLLYFASRVFLLVEVFRNLAFLDPQVYQTPDVRNQPAKPCQAFIAFITFYIRVWRILTNEYTCVVVHIFPSYILEIVDW